ncbi:galactosylceramide sulfotransferase-like [Saccoglossus kowalevskii]|uniref:Galactosylceramide sulfotransferase-like n=1 Tax=Saccoglossus kowalevskii TaxID=10224 RepID=A0ABM0GWH5_SACKO|nr:PREDICTED: galactosylceramide sulfotransferase-like [Saccoglossus kowalevskii]
MAYVQVRCILGSLIVAGMVLVAILIHISNNMKDAVHPRIKTSEVSNVIDPSPTTSRDIQYKSTDFPTENASCNPVENIVFLKTHKTGSSTVQNILFRYGEKHNLTFALPKPPRINLMGWPEYFNEKFMIQIPGGNYNIFTFHTRFDYEAIKSIMPVNTVYITILRDPVTQYESLFTYHQMQRKLNIPKISEKSSLEVFLENPLKYYKSDGYNGLSRNPSLYDLGFRVDFMDDTHAIRKQIKEVEDVFDFVMLTEYMEESLILLRHLLCWEIEDIVHFKLNSRLGKSKRYVDQLAEGIRGWNHADVALYNYFNATFWGMIKEFGEERMELEVKTLKNKIEELFKFCVKGLTDDVVGFVPQGVQIFSYELNPHARNNTLCKNLIRTEYQFTYRLKNKYIHSDD